MIPAEKNIYSAPDSAQPPMSSDDNDKSTEQVLEYYKKYSQNRNLPKYFSGTSVSYLPPIAIDKDDQGPTVNLAKNSLQYIPQTKSSNVSEIIKIIVDEPKDALSSPNASSLESPSEHKKLEWDNGADIGYKSARIHSEKRLQKSLSLPILDNLKDLNTPTQVSTIFPAKIIKHSTSNDNVEVLVFSSTSASTQMSSKNSGRQDLVSSSSATTDIPKEGPVSTETSSSNGGAKIKISSQSDSDESRFSDFQMTINHLKHKIGLPGAQSTPYVVDLDNRGNNLQMGDSSSSKPSLVAVLSHDLDSKGTSKEKLGLSSSTSRTASNSLILEVSKSKGVHKSKNSSNPMQSSTSLSKSPTKKSKRNVETKIIELSISTPINVNCKGFASSDKTLQTLYSVTPKAVQTENYDLQYREDQFNFKNLDFHSKRHLQTNFLVPVAVQTETMNHHNRETQCNVDSAEEQISDHKSNGMSICEDMADSASSFEYISVGNNSGVFKSNQNDVKSINHHNFLQDKTTSISGVIKEVSLSKSTIKSSSLSKTSSEDIDRHLEILQKLFRNKKINSKTKRKYIKTLLKDLSELETSYYDSNTSSDLFVPKKENDKLKPKLKSKVVFNETGDLTSSYRTKKMGSHFSLAPEYEHLQSSNALAQKDVSNIHKSTDLEAKAQKRNLDRVDVDKDTKRLESFEKMPSSSNQHVPEQVQFECDNVSSVQSKNVLKESTKTSGTVNQPILGLHQSGPSNSQPLLTTDNSNHLGLGRQSYKVFEGNGNKVNILETEPPSRKNYSSGNGFHTPKSSLLEGSTQLTRPLLQDQVKQTLEKYISKDIGVAITDKTSKDSSQDNTIKTQCTNRHHRTVNLNKKSSDEFLLRFAENERTYQLNWISNEISHLSKLKRILELKNKTTSKQSSPSARSVYSVQQKDSRSNSSSERNYVIETNFKDISPEQTVNYVLDGKEYVVLDSQKSSSSDSDKAIIADIEIHSSDTQTNIKVMALCSTCNQMACGCPSKTTMQSKISSLSSEGGGSGVCLSCKQIICICPKREDIGHVLNKASKKSPINSDGLEGSIDGRAGQSSNQSAESTKFEETIFQDFNSLQKVFKKCCCTVDNPNCGCDFVNKLLNKFRNQREKIGTTSEAAQTDTLSIEKPSSAKHKRVAFTTSTCQTSFEDFKSKTLAHSTQSNQAQDQMKQSGVSDKHISLQTLRDVLCKSTQTQNVEASETIQPFQEKMFKDKELCTCGNIVSKDCAIQSLDPKSTVNTQTSKPRFKDDMVQTRKEVTSNAVQTEQPYISRGTDGRRDGSSLNIDDCDCGKQKVVSSKDSSGALVSGVKVIGLSIKEHGIQENDILLKINGQTSQKTLDHQSSKPEDSVLKGECTGTFSGNNEAATMGRKTVDQGTQYMKNSSSVQTSSANITATTSQSDATSSGSSRITCSYCKQKAFLAEVSYLQDGNDSLVVCSRCYYNTPRHCSHNPRFMCRCWTYAHPQQNVGSVQDCPIQYCKCCRMEASKCLRRPKGLVYTVTLENEGATKRRRRNANDCIENIKVQKGWSPKTVKEKENYGKRDDYRKNSLRKERRTKRLDDEDKDDMEKDKSKKKTKKGKKKVDSSSDREDSNVQFTLMEYLIQNRPEFICSAEYRRQMLLNSRILRERQKDNLKLNFLENNLRSTNEANYKLFTEREMKDINKKNYKKLPEVQQRIMNQRETRLRDADRLISNMFTKKVQKSILQGRGTFPIDKPVTNV